MLLEGARKEVGAVGQGVVIREKTGLALGAGLDEEVGHIGDTRV